MDDLRFQCVMGKTLIATTVGIIVVLVSILAVSAYALVRLGQRTGWPGHVTKLGAVGLGSLTVVFAATILMSYLYAPQEYLLDAQTLVIARPLSPVSIPLGEIREVRRVQPGELKGTLRSLGSDGLFARTGRFHSPALGNFRMHAKILGDAVVVDTETRYVLSPSEPDRFVAQLRERISL